MKYHIIVFGCQMNISDSERIASVLENINYKKTSNINKADLIAVVMCSVRQPAVDRVMGLVEKFKTLKKSNPELKTILTGCVFKKNKRIFMKDFDRVIDIKEIKKLPDILNIKNNLKNKDYYLDITPKYSSKFSAYVPIMTGCNNFCAYCVVPYTRGREISRSAEDIVCEIKNLIKHGSKGIWLLGQNVNSYKDNGIKFPDLLKMVNDIPGNFWIRFTSPHPKDFSEQLIDAIASGKKITPYLNLPVQAGDDKVLKNMNRPYTVAQYKLLVKKIRKKIPDICLSTDIIVGFPGETKKQFENAAKLFRDIKYDMAYINKYSKRPGTAASRMKDDVSTAEKKRREKILTEILKQTALEINKKFIGKESIVLIDGRKGDNCFGKNEHYKTVHIKSLPRQIGDKNLIGKFVKVKITDATSWGLKGIFKK